MIIEKKATQRGNEGTTVRGHENDGATERRYDGTRTMERGNEKKDDDLIVNIIPRPQAWHYYRRCDLFGGNFLSP